MPDEPPLHVTRYNRGSYLVRSQRKGIGNYQVEMDDPMYPLGRCECDDWNIRIEYKMRNDLEPERLTCVHINAVNAAIAHARHLCEMAGLPFNLNIIPEA